MTKRMGKQTNFCHVTADTWAPRHIVIGRHGEVVLKPMCNANYTLVDRLDYALAEGPFNYDYAGTVLAAYNINIAGRAHIYYRHDQQALYTRREINVLLSYAMANDYSVYYNQPLALENLISELESTNKVTTDEVSLIKKLESSVFINVSSHYQQHYRPEVIYNLLTPEEKQLVNCVGRLGDQLGAACLAGCIVWLLSLSPVLYSLVVQSRLLDATSEKEFDEIGKILSVRAKRLQNICEVDLKSIFEVNVLVNRIASEIDWNKEYLNRTMPNLVNISPEYVYKRAVEVMTTPLEGDKRYNRTSWRKFWSKRWEWATSGAVHSQHKEDHVYFSKDRDFKNKFIAICGMPYFELHELLKEEPEIVCSASIKYEWGKQRAIYGTDLRSYILTTFAFQNCEDLLPNQFLIGEQSRASLVSAKLGSVLSQRMPFCMDFEDFNSQHSVETMEAVMQAFYTVYSKHMSEEQALAFGWVLQSIRKTIVNDNIGLKRSYQTTGTLMSGWRLTSWMNSICNYIYSTAILGQSYSSSRAVHSGDDVLIAVNNFDSVLKCVKRAEELNIRLSVKKCNYGSVAEFLRVDHVDGTYGQYLPRGIATLIHSRMESQPAFDVRDLVEATETRLSEFVDRGGHNDLAMRLRNQYFSRISSEWTKGHVDLFRMRLAHRVCGGISTRNDSTLDYCVIRQPPLPRSSKLDIELHGVSDYSYFLKESLPFEVSFTYIKRFLTKRTIQTFSKDRVKYHVTEANARQRQQARIYRGIWKSHNYITHDHNYGRAKLIGKLQDMFKLLAGNTLLNFVVTDKTKLLEVLEIVT